MKRALLSIIQNICIVICFTLGIFIAYMIIKTIKMWIDNNIVFNISDTIPIFICAIILAICGAVINIIGDYDMNKSDTLTKPKPQNSLFDRDE